MSVGVSVYPHHKTMRVCEVDILVIDWIRLDESFSCLLGSLDSRRGGKTKTDLAFTESRTIEEATRRQIEIVSYACISQCSLEILLS